MPKLGSDTDDLLVDNDDLVVRQESGIETFRGKRIKKIIESLSETGRK